MDYSAKSGNLPFTSSCVASRMRTRELRSILWTVSKTILKMATLRCNHSNCSDLTCQPSRRISSQQKGQDKSSDKSADMRHVSHAARISCGGN